MSIECLSGREEYGKALVKLGGINDKVVVLDADAAKATKSIYFKQKFPERFFDMGISEQDMMATAAGLAQSGFIPFTNTFAVFAAGRAFEQIRNGICYPKLNVKIALGHSGISNGGDGATHQSIEDISIMRSIPNMTVIVPADGVETRKAVMETARFNGPVCLRNFRYTSPVIYDDSYRFEIGKASVLKEGNDICIMAAGIVVYRALLAAERLKKNGINASVINVSTIKPLDEEIVLKYAKAAGMIITVEEHSIIGGLGSAVLECLSDKYPVPLKRIGLNDCFGQSGEPDDVLLGYGFTSENIALITEDFLKEKV